MLDAHPGIPKVVMDWGPESSSADKIIDNSEEGGYLATKYLVDNGHKRIACLTGQAEKLACIERISGYKRALEEANIDFDEKNIFEGNFECDTAVETADKLFALPEEQRPYCCILFQRHHGSWPYQSPKTTWLVGARRHFDHRLRQYRPCGLLCTASDYGPPTETPCG